MKNSKSNCFIQKNCSDYWHRAMTFVLVCVLLTFGTDIAKSEDFTLSIGTTDFTVEVSDNIFGAGPLKYLHLLNSNDLNSASFDLRTDSLSIRDANGHILDWCEAEPLIKQTLTTQSILKEPYLSLLDDFSYLETNDGVTLKIPNGLNDYLFFFSYVNEDSLKDYQKRLGLYIDIFTNLFSQIELQALISSSNYDVIKEKYFDYVGTNTINAVDILGRFADIYEDQMNKNKEIVDAEKLARLSHIADITGVIFASLEAFNEEKDKQQFINKAFALPLAELKMISILEHIEKTSVYLDPAMKKGAIEAYKIIRDNQRNMLGAIEEATKTGIVETYTIFIKFISDRLLSFVGEKAVKWGGGAISGALTAMKDLWDFNQKVTYWVLLLNTSEKLYAVIQDNEFYGDNTISPESYREAFYFSNTISLYEHSFAYNLFVEERTLSQLVWYLFPSYREFKDNLINKLEVLEKNELNNYKFYLYLDQSVDLIKSIYAKPCVNNPPIAKITLQNTGDIFVDNTVQLDGSDSSDPENENLSYKWSLFTPNGSIASLSSINNENTSFIPDKVGSYTVKLIVDDGTSESTTNKSIIINPPSAEGHDLSINSADISSGIAKAGNTVYISKLTISNNGKYSEEIKVSLTVEGPGISETIGPKSLGFLTSGYTDFYNNKLYYTFPNNTKDGFYTFTVMIFSDTGDETPNNNIRVVGVRIGKPPEDIQVNAYEYDLTDNYGFGGNKSFDYDLGETMLLPNDLEWRNGGGFGPWTVKFNGTTYKIVVSTPFNGDRISVAVYDKNNGLIDDRSKIYRNDPYTYDGNRIVIRTHYWDNGELSLEVGAPSNSISLTPSEGIVQVGDTFSFEVHMEGKRRSGSVHFYPFLSDSHLFKSSKKDNIPNLKTDVDMESYGASIEVTPSKEGIYEFVVDMPASSNSSRDVFLIARIVAEPKIQDSDNDGIPDSSDAFPSDPAACIDTDKDGYPDTWNNGKTEADSTTGLRLDAFPNDPNFHSDSDSDGVADIVDAFPNDPNELHDSDSDSVGDNSDAFPNDPAASVDTDGDGMPDAWNQGKTQEDSLTGLILDPAPDEYGTGNSSPSITILKPDTTNSTADSSYTIKWIDSDDNNNATISLFYDNNNTGQDGTAIEGAESIPQNDPVNFFEWDITGIQAGEYYIYAIIDDGVNDPIINYSSGTLTINHLRKITVTTIGSGTITSDPEGIDCGSDCTEVYNKDTEVILKATPDENSFFEGWSGACTGTGDCKLTLDSDVEVTATFNLNTYTIKVSAGQGGKIEPSGDISVEHGESKTFTITPDTGYHIEDVIVDDASFGDIESYPFDNISADHTINATFANAAPIISDIYDQTTDENVPTESISFMIEDAETPAQDLILSAESSNTTLIPNSNIVFGGELKDRTIIITPAENQFGVCDITVTVTDVAGTDSKSTSVTFKLDVKEVIQSGSLKVTIIPEEAVQAGAQWKIDEAWHNSEDTEENLTVGSYTISFNSIDGWESPPEQSIEVLNEEIISVTGEYKEINGTVQQVYIDDSTLAPAGSTISLSVNYNVSDGDKNLSGLGVRIHFDSSKLTWEGFDNILSEQKFGEDQEPIDDTEDYDNDALTDKFLTVAWVSFSGDGWPNQDLPLKLYDISFTINQSLSENETTKINFSASGIASGSIFSGETHIITVIPFNWDIDGDGKVEPLTDGLLLLRYLFGFRGDTLIQDAINPSATRTRAEEIEEYLSENISFFDIDGDGKVEPLTDGLLSLRYLFGFRGDTLIQDAIDPDATRTTSDQIEEYIANYLP